MQVARPHSGDSLTGGAGARLEVGTFSTSPQTAWARMLRNAHFEKPNWG